MMQRHNNSHALKVLLPASSLHPFGKRQKLCNKIQGHMELEALSAICPMAPFWPLDPYAMRFSIWHKKI